MDQFPDIPEEDLLEVLGLPDTQEYNNTQDILQFGQVKDDGSNKMSIGCSLIEAQSGGFVIESASAAKDKDSPTNIKIQR